VAPLAISGDHAGGSHTGIDITAPAGTPVVAACDGTVANIQPNPSKTYGNQVVIQHAGGLNTQYAHLGQVDVKPGATVHAGDQIGLSGTTGNVWKGNKDNPPTTPHLHFEIRRGSIKPHSTGGQVVDPMQYLPATP
jgi:murein DD-endopeptidase MepM/ murein hydrolase activator NlpD